MFEKIKKLDPKVIKAGSAALGALLVGAVIFIISENLDRAVEFPGADEVVVEAVVSPPAD